MWEKVSTSKVKIICGDMNIDPNRNRRMTNFINTMYSNNLFPFPKPIRITADTATLIGNIFTNKIEINIKAGLLLHDLSDHLPIFAVLQNVLKIKKEKNTYVCKLTRKRTPATPLLPLSRSCVVKAGMRCMLLVTPIRLMKCCYQR